MGEGVCDLGGRCEVGGRGTIVMDQFKETLHVVLVAVHFGNCLICSPVLAACAVAEVDNAELLSGTVVEDHSHAKDLGVEIYARGYIPDVKRKVVNVVAGSCWIGWIIGAGDDGGKLSAIGIAAGWRSCRRACYS